jgi:hypothetical protein
LDRRFEMSHTDHGDMDMGSSGSSGGGGHSVLFQTDTATPLYGSMWTPSSPGAYAGTCIFLVALAAAARLLVAAKSVQEARWRDQAARRRYVAVNGRAPLAERMVSGDLGLDARQLVLSANGLEEKVFVVEQRPADAARRPWRFSVDPVRAAVDTTIVGVGYLLYVCRRRRSSLATPPLMRHSSQHVGRHDHERRILHVRPRWCLYRQPRRRSL